jgi:hypothetical protein
LVIDTSVFLKVMSSAERIHSMEDHIQDLENDLQMSRVVRKHLELRAHHLKRETLAYKTFVSDLIFALSQKGIARVIDDQGYEASHSFYNILFSYLR